MPRLEGPSEDDTYVVHNGRSRMECFHHLHPPADGSVVYVGCAAMLFLGFYWSPVLSCMVSPKDNSIILADDLCSLVQKDVNLDQIVNHILSSFQIKDQQLAFLFQTKLRDEVVKIPIPGLCEAESRYQCSDCGIWCSTPINHKKNSPTCKDFTHWQRYHSIPLYPPGKRFQSSKGADYRIQLSIPDHRNLRTDKPPLRPSLQNECQNMAEDESLIETWTDVKFSNPRGPSAAKLVKEEQTQAFHFSISGRTFSCLHLLVSPRPGSHIYTGCAVLSYFQCFLSPILKAVVQPRESTLLDVAGMTKLFSSRQHGQPVELLVAHITESFNLLPMATPHDMFRAVHKHLMVCTPLQGLSDPKFVIQCQTCLECFSNNKSLQSHQDALHPDKPASSIETHAIRLWNSNKYASYRIVMDTSWCSSHREQVEQPRVRIPILSYENPPHLRNSGFQEHLESWGIHDYSILHQLYGLDSQVEISWTPGSLSKNFHDCIPRIHQLLRVYLLDAEQRMQSSPNLRRLISLIPYAPRYECPISLCYCVLTTASLQGKFNTILSESLMTSRHLISMTLAATIRFISLQIGSKRDKDPDKRICIERLKELQSLKLEFPTSAKSILKTFAKDVSSSHESLSDSYLLDFVHRFLLALYTSRYSEDLKISSALEQTLIFICLTEDMKWKSAKRTYGEITHCFRWGKTLLAHAAALGGVDTPYASPPHSANGQVVTMTELTNDDTSSMETATFDPILEPEHTFVGERGSPQLSWGGYACVLASF